MKCPKCPFASLKTALRTLWKCPLEVWGHLWDRNHNDYYSFLSNMTTLTTIFMRRGLHNLDMDFEERNLRASLSPETGQSGQKNRT